MCSRHRYAVKVKIKSEITPDNAGPSGASAQGHKDGPSWKIHVCSRNKWTLLENYKKVAPGKKEQIFSKTVSVAPSGYL